MPKGELGFDIERLPGTFSWRSPLGPLHQPPLLAITFLCLFGPADILSRHPFALDIVNKVRSTLMLIHPSADIAKFAYSTDFPEVALLATALYWLWLPYSMLIYMISFEYVKRVYGYTVWKRLRGHGGRIQIKDIRDTVFGNLFFLTGLYILTMRPGGWSLIDPGGMTRISMGFVFWAAFFCASFPLTNLYTYTRTFIDINLRGK